MQCSYHSPHSPPEVDEFVAQNTTMPAAIAVVITHALPGNDGSQSLWLTRSNAPLRSSIVADTKQTNFSRGPWLLSSPLNDIEEALACTSRHRVQKARRLTQTTLVSTNNDIVVLCPETWVWRLPGCVIRVVLWIDF
jgi:hypothetical protein